MIYTSYFARLNKISEFSIPIAISLYQPKFYTGLKFTRLAPTLVLIRDSKIRYMSEEEYIIRYCEKVLDNLDAKEIVDDLYSLVESYPNNQDITLLCYEKSESLCHRHIVSCWLTKNGFPCKEYQP